MHSLCYALRYPDLLSAFCTDDSAKCNEVELQRHWETQGHREGRTPNCSRAMLHNRWVAAFPSRERRVYSQNGEDGVLEHLFSLIGTTSKFYAEFGVEDGAQCNTRYLRTKGWSGLLINGSNEDASINLHKEFTRIDNVVSLLQKYSVPTELDLLSVDTDCFDWWLLRNIFRAGFRPRAVITEVNSHASMAPPIAKVVSRHEGEYCSTAKGEGYNTWFGGSVSAFWELFRHFNYSMVYCEHQGRNCVGVRDDVLDMKGGGRLSDSLSDIQLYRPPMYGPSNNGWPRPIDPHHRRFDDAREILGIKQGKLGAVRSPLARPIEGCSLPPEARWCLAEIYVGGERKFFSMACWKEHDVVCSDICTEGSWEVSSVEPWVPQHRGAGLLLDVGANVGWFTMLFAMSGWSVIAVEAHPSNAALLNASLCRNRAAAQRVRLVNAALMSSERKLGSTCHAVSTPENAHNMRMCCDADFPSNCADFGATQGLRADSGQQYVDHGIVPLATLDGVLRSIGAPAVDVVKMDVEGFECEVVRGGHTVFMGTHQLGRRPHTVRVELQSDPPLGIGMKDCNTAQFTRMLSPAYNVTSRLSSPAGNYVDAVFELTRTHQHLSARSPSVSGRGSRFEPGGGWGANRSRFKPPKPEGAPAPAPAVAA